MNENILVGSIVFLFSIIETLVFRITKMRKSVVELGHRDLLPVYKSSFATETLHILVKFNKNGLQMKSFQI